MPPAATQQERNFNTLPRNYAEEAQASAGEAQQLAKRPESEAAPDETFNLLSTEDEYPVGFFKYVVSEIVVEALPCTQMPPASNLIPMLNTGLFLRSYEYLEDALDCDFLTGRALVGGRKFIQAVEVFRRLEEHLLGGTEFGSQNARVLEKAAKIEVLIADCSSQHTQLAEKLHSLRRATHLYMRREPAGRAPAPSGRELAWHKQEEDVYAELLTLQPHLIKFVLKGLGERVEPIRIAFLKTLEFLLDTLGCSLEMFAVHVLRTIIATYPSQAGAGGVPEAANTSAISGSSLVDSHEFFLIEPGVPPGVAEERRAGRAGERVNDQTIAASTVAFSNVLKNLYNHLLESYLGVLSSTSSNILHTLF